MILYVKTMRFSATATFAYYYYLLYYYRILHNMCRTLVNAMHIDIIIVHRSSSVDLQLYRFCTYTMCATYYLVSHYLQRERDIDFYLFELIKISFARTRVLVGARCTFYATFNNFHAKMSHNTASIR